MAIRFAAKETPAEPPKAKKQAGAAGAQSPQPGPAVAPDETATVPSPAAGDLFGSEPKKAPRGRKKK